MQQISHSILMPERWGSQNAYFGEAKVADLSLRTSEEITVDALCSDCMEARVTLSPDNAVEFGIKLLCPPGGDGETTITCNG